jgi:hypothetical protein
MLSLHLTEPDQQQHKRQVEELDLEMKAELEKSKEELNRNLEVTLDNELKVNKLLNFTKSVFSFIAKFH